MKTFPHQRSEHKVFFPEKTEGGWDVRCSCGWAAYGMSTFKQAEDIGNDHLREMAK